MKVIFLSIKKAMLFAALFLCLVPFGGWSVSAEDRILNFREADIRAVIEDVARMTGKTFIIDPRVNGKVTIIAQEPVPRERVFDIFLSTLRVYGFTAVPSQDGVYKIVPEESAILDRTALADNAGGDQLVTEIFRLHTLDPIIALNTLKPLVNRLGRVIAQQRQNFIIVVDYAGNMARIRQIVRDLDADTSVTRMVSLENMSALDMAETIARLRGADREQNGRDANLNLVPVARSSMLLVKGEAALVDKTVELIEALDKKNIHTGSIKVIYLQHADAEKMVPMLEQVSRAVSGTGEDVAQGPGRTSVSFHQATNSLVISADPEMQKTLAHVVQQLDIPRARILVEAIIVEVSDRAAKELGLQYVFSGGGNNTIPFSAASYSNTASNVLAATGATLLDGAAGTEEGNTLRQAAFDSLFNNFGYSGGVATRTANGSVFGVILNALDQDVDSNILSTPSVMTIDNEPARLIVGQEIPITTGETLGNDNSNPFRTIERQDVGIKLEVRPQINAGKNIRLYIKQEVSSISGTTGPSSGELITNKREIETTVIAEDGEIIVLGGLIEQDEQITLDKIPFLGDIPLIGRAFRSERKSRVKRNLMVFLRPIIIRDAAQMEDVTARKYDYMRREQIQSSGDQEAEIDRLLREVLGTTPPEAPSAPAAIDKP